ncbi:MAG: DUF4340 domain-containing protein [bacterium]
MKPKTSWTLFAVVAIIVGLVLAYQYWYKPAQEEKEIEESVFFPDLDPEKADRIEIKKGSTATVLAADGGTAWKVETQEGYPADSVTVNKALEMIERLKRDSPASTNPDNFEKLGVTEDKGLHVKVSEGGKVVAELLAGKRGEAPSTTFARMPGEDTAYLVNEGLNSALDKDEWRDLMVFAVEPEDVEKIETARFAKPAEGDTAARPGKRLTLRRAGKEEAEGQEKEAEGKGQTDWEVVSGDTVKESEKGKVKSVVRNLCRLKASEFADSVSSEDAGLEDPLGKIVLHMKEGSPMVLLVGKKDGSRYFVKREDSDLIMKAPAYAVDRAFDADEKEKKPDSSSMLPPPDLKKGKRPRMPNMPMPGRAGGEPPPPPEK